MRIAVLTRRFSLLSLGLILLAATVIGLLVRRHEITQLEAFVQERNVAMTQFFMNLVSDDLLALLDRPLPTSDEPEVVALSRRLASLLNGADIAKLKLYNLQGKVVYSTDPAQFGEDKSLNAGFASALNGKVFSELVHRDQFSTTEGERFDVDLVSSYVPILRDEKVLAVFELYQDVTRETARMKAAWWQAMMIVLGVMLTLYVVQFMVLQRARSVIRTQEAELEEANRSLDQRIMERTRELQDSQARIRELLDEQQLIFDNAHVGILVLKSRRVLKANQRIADMFGYASPEDFKGWSTAIFYCSDRDFQVAGQSGYSQLSEKGFADLETKMRRRDGSVFWVIQSGRPLNPQSVLDSPSIWIYTDITDRKRAEAELGIAAAAFESQEAMVVTDANCVILRVNKAFSEMTGYRPEEAIGQTPRILQSGLHDKSFYETMWESINRTGSWQGEIWDRHKSGSIVPKLLTISAVTGRDGTVSNFVGTQTDISERKLAEEKIRHLAFFDHLTDLPNRTMLADRLNQALVASERAGKYGAILFIDLDHFKTLNDTLGHDQGDLLLMQVAAILSRNIRKGDTVARLGGDEFVVLLCDLKGDVQLVVRHVEATARKFLQMLKQDYPLRGTSFHISASIGVSLFFGTSVSVDELLKQADLAMYKSKEAGRNAFTFFDPAMSAHMLARTRTDANLRLALKNEQFVLHYQPQVDGPTGSIVGAEALIRWNHPTLGVVFPNDFIQIAEESGLILPIGQWVLTSACRQLAVWAAQPAMKDLSLAVNVSVQQFRQPDFAEQVLATLATTGANPCRLKLELTESLFVQNIDDIIGKMSILKAQGVSFSLDDFGTGYSSLAYLSRLPLDQLKIDRSFVHDIDSSDNNVVICAATIKLAHSLGMVVVAEGVESESQRYFLTTVHRCDFLQGYLFGKPMPIGDFEELLET